MWFVRVSDTVWRCASIKHCATAPSPSFVCQITLGSGLYVPSGASVTFGLVPDLVAPSAATIRSTVVLGPEAKVTVEGNLRLLDWMVRRHAWLAQKRMGWLRCNHTRGPGNCVEAPWMPCQCRAQRACVVLVFLCVQTMELSGEARFSWNQVRLGDQSSLVVSSLGRLVLGGPVQRAPTGYVLGSASAKFVVDGGSVEVDSTSPTGYVPPHHINHMPVPQPCQDAASLRHASSCLL
jgi:hypothetical protein